MLRPVTTSTTGPETSPSWPSAASPAAAAPSTRRPSCPERGDGLRELPLGDEQHAIGGRLERGDRERNRDANSEAVRERRRAVARDRSFGVPALDHHRRLARCDTDSQRRGCELSERSADPRQQRTVPDGNDDGSGRFGKLLDHLRGDRRIPVQLSGLGTVLEEGHVMFLRPRTSLVLRIVDVGAREPDLGSELTHQIELRAADVLGRVDDRSQTEPLRRPRRRGAVIAGGGRDHETRPVAAVPLQRGKCATPLERAELVNVLALEIDSVPGASPAGAGSRGVGSFTTEGRGFSRDRTPCEEARARGRPPPRR